MFTPDRQALDIDQYTSQELERLIPSDIVAVNNRYQYFDMGVVDAIKGLHTLYFDKRDGNPLLVEGILVIPEEAYQNLALPKNVRWLQSAEDLCCGALLPDQAAP